MRKSITGSGLLLLAFNPLTVWAQGASHAADTSFDKSDVAILLALIVLVLMLFFIGGAILFWNWKINAIVNLLKEISTKLSNPNHR